MNPKNRVGSLSPLRFSRNTALLASLSLTLLAGCGGSGGNNNINNGGSGSAGVFANKSFVASSLALGTGQTGSLTVAVGTDATSIAGTLNLVIAAVSGETKSAATRQTASGSTTISVPLAGTFTPSTGGFSLKGIVYRATTPYNVTVTGTLSTSGTTGGTIQIAINDTNFSGSFAAAQTLSGTLSAAYVPLTYSPNLVYQETDTSNNGTPSVSTVTGYSFLGGFGTPLGATTQAQLNGITVNKTAELNPDGSVSGYDYYTNTSSALTFYGFDDASSESNSMERFTPGYTLPLTLTAGQIHTQTVTDTSSYSGSTAAPSSYSFTSTLTFNGFESVTVPAGTYTAAKITQVSTFAFPATSTSGASTNSTTSSIYLVANLGVVQEHDVDSYSYAASGSNPASSGSYTIDYVLTSTSSDETRAASPVTASNRRVAPGLFGLLRGNHR